MPKEKRGHHKTKRRTIPRDKEMQDGFVRMKDKKEVRKKIKKILKNVHPIENRIPL
jgi:hypothetical protein